MITILDFDGRCHQFRKENYVDTRTIPMGNREYHTEIFYRPDNIWKSIYRGKKANCLIVTESVKGKIDNITNDYDLTVKIDDIISTLISPLAAKLVVERTKDDQGLFEDITECHHPPVRSSQDPIMPEATSKEAREMESTFISYVKENKDTVDRLYQELKSHGIKVWLDREDIDPGTRWEPAIRRAIQQGAFFIACLSKEYNERDKTYMNTELTVAIKELHQRPTDRIWFIPVKLNDCEIPDRDIGGGETLRDFQYVNLYEDWDRGIQRILKVIQPASSESINANTSEHPINQNAEVYYDLGNTYHKEEDYDRAIAAFTRAIELKQDYPGAYTNRGVAYRSKGDYERAIENHDKAIELKPDCANAYFNRGDAYKNRGDAYKRKGDNYHAENDYDLAIADFTQAIERKPDFVGAYNHRGVAHRAKGDVSENESDYDLAIKDFIKAIELDPNNAEVHNNLGITYRKKGEIDRAIEYHNKAIECKPDFGSAYFNRGLAWLLLKEWEKAKSDLTTAKEKGANIIKEFGMDYESVSDFEGKHDIQLPSDIAAMLTPPQA